MIELILLCLLGCFFGTITGLMPGIHVNTICAISIGIFLFAGVSELGFGVFICSMSLTHTFLEYIPAIFVGIPQEDTALSLLPSHILVLRGKASKAVYATGIGSLIGLVLSVSSMFFLIQIIPGIYHFMNDSIGYVIIGLCFILIVREKGIVKYAQSVLVFFASGLFGLIVFSINSLSTSQAMLPAFTGLFGISTIITSLKEETLIPPQSENICDQRIAGLILPSLIGTLGGILVGLLPAMSPSQIGILLSVFFGNTPVRFLACLGAINTADSVYSFVSLHSLGNPRSGAAVFLSKVIELDYNMLIIFAGVFCISGSVAYGIHIFIGKRVIRKSEKINYCLISKCILVFLFALVYFLTGFLGTIILLTSSALGLSAIQAKISRTHLMGFLIVPTLCYFFC